MKVHLKTTNKAENASETLVCHQMGQRTVNGIIGNTRCGIRADQMGASIQSIDGYVVSDGVGAIATDLTNIKLKVPFVLNLYEDNTLSGEPEVQVVMTNNIGGLYYIGMVSLIGQTLVVMAKDESDEYRVSMGDIPISVENTLFNKPIMVPDNLDDPIPILPCSMNDNGKVLSVVNGEAQWSNASGLAKIQCTRKDYQDLTKGGTIDNSILPTIDVPFILEVGMDGNLSSSGNDYKGKLDFLMNYYHYDENSGDHKKSWFGYANDSTGYYTAYIKEDQDVVFAKYVNTNAKIVDIELPTKAKPITSTTTWSIADITSGALTIQNHYDVHLFGSLWNKYRSPVYSDTNGTLYYYIIDYDLDGGDDTLAMKYIEIPTSSSSSSTITITFED